MVQFILPSFMTNTRNVTGLSFTETQRRQTLTYHQQNDQEVRVGFMVYSNSTIINWFLMKQSTVKKTVLEAKFLAVKQVTDVLRDRITS